MTLGTFGDIWRHLGTFGDIWGHLGTFGDIWGHLGTFGDMILIDLTELTLRNPHDFTATLMSYVRMSHCVCMYPPADVPTSRCTH